MQKKAWRSLKWLSLAISLGSIVITVLLMQSGDQPAPASDLPATDEPKTQVDSPIIIERKDGKITWQLRAEEASQQLDGKMRLNDPTLTLYSDGGREIRIQSTRAWFDPIARNVRFEDHVRVFYEQWTMRSELMLYISGEDEIRIPGTFRIEGKSIRAHGKNMHLHRSAEEINVEDGIWIEDSDSHWQGEQS